MRNTYTSVGIIKLPRPGQFYCGFAVTNQGSWSATQYVKNMWRDKKFAK